MPGDSVTLASLRAVLGNPEAIRENPFGVLRDLCAFAATSDPQSDRETEVQEAVLRALDQRDAFDPYSEVLDALVRRIGLFPYLTPAELGFADLVAYEFHRPQNMDEAVVFHSAQARVYRTLMAGESVVLSAPTSFGKSLIIDAVIAASEFKTVVIVVPTLALIDETRRRLARRFRERFKVITHRFQPPGQRTIYVLTPERVVDFSGLRKVDFFVIDEFYKLAPDQDTESRWNILNQAFYFLHRRCKHFYMLGPNVLGISGSFQSRVGCRLIVEPYRTVVTEVHRVDPGRDEYSALISLCQELEEPTIVFCKSPQRVSEVARRFIDAGLGFSTPETLAAADWVAEHYHAEWHFGKALRQGIGVHHGRIPRALAQYVVRSFNAERVRFLVCTSTLIEGVNTKAKNIVVFDNKINKSLFDLFTFNNIKGRSGRMMEHFIGHVYLFHDPPEGPLPFVEIPVVDQGPKAPESLLIQLDEQDLTPESQGRLTPFLEQSLLDVDTLRQNAGIDLETQIHLAEEINSNLQRYHPLLSWGKTPTYNQLLFVCDLFWRHFSGPKLGSGSVRTAKQLTYLILQLRNRPTTHELIAGQLERAANPDEAVQRTLDFLRLWAIFNFPRLLRAVGRIQRDVFSRATPSLTAGHYDWFAKQVEHLFLDPALAALEEYGIPLEVARKISSAILVPGNLDGTLDRLIGLDPDTLDLSDFERQLVRDAQDGL